MNSTNTFNKKFSPVGAMFMSVGTNTWKLGELKLKEGSIADPNLEYLQEFDPQTGAIGNKYTYIDAKVAKSMPYSRWTVDPVGWWVKPSGKFGPAPTTEKADNVEFKAGQGLYSNFENANVKIDFSGEVVCEEWQLDLTNKKFSPIINYLARTITLKEIVLEEGSIADPNLEYIQEFDPQTGAIGNKYTYIDAKVAKSMPYSRWTVDPVGWWVKPSGKFGPAPTTEKADSVKIEPGAGFYSNFENANVKLNFPSSIPAKKEVAE